jgi:tight adherence protein B
MDVMKMIYIIVILTFLFVWALASAVFFTLFYKNKPVEKLKYYDEDYRVQEIVKSEKKNRVSVLKTLSNLVPDTRLNEKRARKLEVELMKADIPITVDELLVIKIISSTVLALLALAIFKNIIAAILVFILVWNMPRIVIASKKKERIKLFDSQLSEGILVISNSLKAGHSFLQAVAVTAEETKDPFSKEFKKLLKEMTLGIDEEEALKNMLSRMESEDLRLIINAILIQKDVGGNLSEILDTIAETIRERQKIKNELKTLTAQGKLSGIIVELIPIFLGLIFFVLNKEHMIVLFTTPLGLTMVAMAVISQIFGIIIIRKIVNIEM